MVTFMFAKIYHVTNQAKIYKVTFSCAEIYHGTNRAEIYKVTFTFSGLMFPEIYKVLIRVCFKSLQGNINFTEIHKITFTSLNYRR